MRKKVRIVDFGDTLTEILKTARKELVFLTFFNFFLFFINIFLNIQKDQ